MKRYSKITPEGSRDFLFEECDDRRIVEHTLSDLFKDSGYRKVLTPAIEFFDVFQSDITGIQAEEMFKLSDSEGRTTVLRPDNTMPIARMVATRLSDGDFPVRLYYNQSVFVRNKDLKGRINEIAQSGVELIGDGSTDADIEVITLAIESLKRCKLNSFKLEIGTAAFFNTILNKLDLDDTGRADICNLIEGKNYAALGDLLNKMGKSRETEVLKKLPRLFGGAEVIDEAKALYNDKEAVSALDYLKSLYDELCSRGLKDYIMLDLGLVNRSNYYTGVIFHGYAEGSGLTILSGGRYDNLLGEFGMKAPAIGFGVEVSAVCEELLLLKAGLKKAALSCLKQWGLTQRSLKTKAGALSSPLINMRRCSQRRRTL